MRLFQINYKKLVFLLLPTYLRSTYLGTFLVAAIQPLILLINTFNEKRLASEYMLNHNGQVCFLRKVLNDAFPERNTSFIIDDYESDGLYLYALTEQSYGHIYAPAVDGLVFYSIEAIISSGANFLVIIPNNLSGTDNFNRIRDLVNIYKLVSKKPIFQYNPVPDMYQNINPT